MKIIFFKHPDFFVSRSMPKFSQMLYDGMKARGYEVSFWVPKPRFAKIFSKPSIRKWFGYIDQFVIFPLEIKKQLKKEGGDTLFVFTDQALGPWVPYIAHLPHVIHCHDFLAQKSASGQLAEIPIGKSGKLYQDLIRRGFNKGQNFISVSKKTQQDLNTFLDHKPKLSEVVYNGFNRNFKIHDIADCRLTLQKKLGRDVSKGYLLHVGGNQWYKNRSGVIEIYDTIRKQDEEISLPLIMIGAKPSEALWSTFNQSVFKDDILWITDADDDLVEQAYCGATVMLFPSIEEGFGWPIAEAMSCGCPVVTTDAAPMTEVAGDAAVLIPQRPFDDSLLTEWKNTSAQGVLKILHMDQNDRSVLISKSVANAKRFNSDATFDEIEKLYKTIFEQ